MPSIILQYMTSDNGWQLMVLFLGYQVLCLNVERSHKY